MAQIYQVKPSDKLLRWLHPGQFNWAENRATSAAFKDDEMSVDILCLTNIEESYIAILNDLSTRSAGILPAAGETPALRS